MRSLCIYVCENLRGGISICCSRGKKIVLGARARVDEVEWFVSLRLGRFVISLRYEKPYARMWKLLYYSRGGIE